MSKTQIVIGGAGALGRSIISAFRSAGWRTVSVDFTENADACANYQLSKDANLEEQVAQLQSQVKDEEKVESVVCAAGGWAGGSMGTMEGIQGVEQMWKMNVQSAVAAANLAAGVLSPKGMLVLTGSDAAMQATPGMVGYGISKAATHHLTKCMAAEGALQPDCTSLCLLPLTMDTPTNRQFMGDNDGTWTPTQEIAEKLLSWQSDLASRPPTGTLMRIVTSAGKTEWVPTQKICGF